MQYNKNLYLTNFESGGCNLRSWTCSQNMGEKQSLSTRDSVKLHIAVSSSVVSRPGNDQCSSFPYEKTPMSRKLAMAVLENRMQCERQYAGCLTSNFSFQDLHSPF